jgi:hypothetical protein
VAELASRIPKHPLTPNCRKDSRTFAKPITEQLGSGISFEDLWCCVAHAGYEGGSGRDSQIDFDPGALGLVRNVFDPLERAPQMLDCLLICAATQGLRGSALVMGNCPGKVACALEMLGELGRNRLQLARPCGFEPTADARMTQGTARRRKSIVQQLAMEIVPEGIELGQGSIRPSGRNTLDDEYALPRQPRAGRLDCLDIDIQDSCNHGCSEFAPHDARRREKVTVTLAELINLAVNEASDIVRDRHELVDGLIPTGVGKLVDDAGHEQRITACPIEQQGRKMRGQRRSFLLSKPSL